MSKWTVLLVCLALLAGGGGGYWLALRQAPSPAEATRPTAAERQPLFYRNPMNPDVTSPVPAKDAMGMDYIPVYADEEQATSPPGTVRIDPVTVQNIGVRTALAEQRTLARTMTAVGRVAYDEQGLVRLHPKTEGWIEKLFVDETGKPVKKNDILLSIYAPQLVTTAQEYLLALNNLDALEKSPFQDVRRGARSLVETTRERLRLLDVPEHQIRELEEARKVNKRLHLHSPATGVIVEIGARVGQYVTSQTELYLIADLNRVWVYVDIYEDELPWVRVGDQATMRLAAFPGQAFQGRLAYIYPYVENKTRTIRARMEFSNPDWVLKPSMFADVTIFASRQIDALVVPSEAVIRSGLRNLVFVVRGPGQFEPREVKLGVNSGEGLVQVREGLTPGDKVVVSGQFLIDSESKLREATLKMLEPRKAATPSSATDHGEHTGGP